MQKNYFCCDIEWNNHELAYEFIRFIRNLQCLCPCLMALIILRIFSMYNKSIIFYLHYVLTRTLLAIEIETFVAHTFLFSCNPFAFGSARYGYARRITIACNCMIKTLNQVADIWCWWVHFFHVRVKFGCFITKIMVHLHRKDLEHFFLWFNIQRINAEIRIGLFDGDCFGTSIFIRHSLYKFVGP